MRVKAIFKIEQALADFWIQQVEYAGWDGGRP